MEKTGGHQQGHKLKLKICNRKKPVIIGRVKEVRDFYHKTQKQFAKSINVSSNTISRIEREEISLTSDIALKIADEYGISLDWLFYYGEEMECPKHLKNLEDAFSCMSETYHDEFLENR